MASAQGSGLAWLVWVLMTVASWGVYGVFLHTGQTALADAANGRYKAFLFVGVAYFLTAVHYAANTPVTFHLDNDPGSTPYTYNVQSLTRVGMTDIYVGKFLVDMDHPAPDPNIARYPIAVFDSYSDYIGLTVETFGLSTTPPLPMTTTSKWAPSLTCSWAGSGRGELCRLGPAMAVTAALGDGTLMAGGGSG